MLDTHLLLWAALDFGALPASAAAWMGNADHELIFSVANIWEVSIKQALGKESFSADPRALRNGLLDGGYTELLIRSEHAIAAGNLPAIHKDPFDRILIAQATVEGTLLLTADPVVARYPGPIQKV